MAKFTSNVVINTRWRNNDFTGAAGSSHTFPDAFYDEFLIDWKEQLDNGNLVITETPTTGNIQVSSLTVGDIVLTGTALGFPSAPTITGTSPINVVSASGTSTISLNANYQTAGTYVTSVTGTSPITTSGTTAITVGIDQTTITGATSATNASVLRAYVKNSTGTTLNKGQVVYVSGSDGANALISLSTASTEAGSSKTLGLLAQTLTTGQQGYVIENGLLVDIDTSAATAGQAVWLGNTPGSFVFGSPPAEPSHSVYLGVVTRVQLNNGEILVKVQNGYELDELHDVSAASPSDADIIQYRTSSGLWTKSSLVNSATSTSTTSVPTANAVRIANNAATAAQSTADLKLAKAGDTLTGTLTISNTGSLAVFGATSTAATQVTTRVDGDASTRWGVRADGFQAWGDGTASRDTNLYRSAASTLATDDNFDVGQSLTVGGDIIHTGQLDFSASGAVAASVTSSGLYLPAGKGVTFEGTTDDGFETRIIAGDPTADRTITLPDLTGTLAIGQTVETTSDVTFSDLTLTDRLKHATQLTFSVAATDAASVISSGFYMPPNKTIKFEGTTDDGFETDLTVINPTADNTISLPNQSGTLAISEAGIVQIWLGASTSIPTGWLLCNGAAVSRTTYAALFTAIGTNFGVGDGSTTFNTPDLAGHLLVGSVSTAPGSAFQTGTTDAYTTANWGHTHSHDHVTNPAATTSGAPSATFTLSYSGGATTATIPSGTHTHSTDIAATTSDTDATSSSSITVLRTRVNYIIKW